MNQSVTLWVVNFHDAADALVLPQLLNHRGRMSVGGHPGGADSFGVGLVASEKVAETLDGEHCATGFRFCKLGYPPKPHRAHLYLRWLMVRGAHAHMKRQPAHP